MKNKITFITDKWCDGVPEKGFSNHFHNLFGSLESTDLNVEYKNYFVDELALKGEHIDKSFNSIIEDSPDMVIVSFLGVSPINPSLGMLTQLSEKGIKVCVMWPDTGYEWARDKIKELENVVDLQVSWDMEEDNFLAKNHIWLWTPEDQRLYYPDKHSVDISFVGSLRGYSDRFNYLKYAVEKGMIDVPNITGGQRENNLTAEEYARRIRTSKININFPESPSGRNQCKGRVFESLASKTLLMEKKSEAAARYFKPNVDYVEFDGLEDFVNKIEYYKANEKEANEIALSGYEKCMNTYSANKFWERVFNEL